MPVASRLLQPFGIREGEASRALLLTLYLFLIVCAYLILKTVRNALFLDEFGALKLPYAMIGIALLAGVCAGGYIRLARRFPLTRILAGSLVFFAANVALFWLGARAGLRWLTPVLYIWAGIFGVVATSQVWTLANELLTVRQAKRLFGPIGAGGILGGAAGGWLSDRLAIALGAPQLLLVVGGLLLGAAATVLVLARHADAATAAAAAAAPGGAPAEAAPRSLADSLRRIAGSPHLKLLAAIVGISALATSSVDFQFSWLAETRIEGRDALAAFFGRVYGTVAAVALVLQLFFTHRALRTLGVGVALLLLPLALMLGTAALLASGALWAGVLLKGSDGSLKHALDRSCRELMYLPVPQSIKLQTKSTIDTVLDRLGDGAAGVLQLALTAGLGFGLRGTLAVNFAICAVWAWLAVRMKRAYIAELSLALGGLRRRFLALPDVAPDADETRAVEGLLAEGSSSDRVGALEWARLRGVPLDAARLADLAADDPDPAVRRAATDALLGPAALELPDAAAAAIGGGDAELVAQAVEAIVDPRGAAVAAEAAAPGEAAAARRLPVLALALRRLGPELEPLVLRLFDRLLDADAPEEARRDAARAIVFFPGLDALTARLPDLVRDADPAVRSRALEVAGALQRLDCLPAAIAALGDPRVRAAARRALRALGPLADEELAAALGDPARPVAVRRRAAPLLGELGRRCGVAALRDALDDPRPEVAAAALEALARARDERPTLELPRLAALDATIDERLAEDGRWVALAAGLAGRDDEAGDYLARALAEHRAARRRTLFRLLAVRYPATGMLRIGAALEDGDPRRRANALEWLDNALPRTLSRHVLQTLEAPAAEAAWPVERGLRTLAESAPPWLAAGAFHAARRWREPGLADAARAASRSPSALVREEAAAYLGAPGEAA